MMTTTGRVPLLDEDGRFPDRFAPASVAVDAAATETAREAAVAARGDAESARAGAESARDGAIAAKEAAEAVPAQVDTAMAEQVGTGGEFDTKLSATIEGLVQPVADEVVGNAITAADIPGQVATATGAAITAADIPGQVAVEAPAIIEAATPDIVAPEVALRVPPAVDTAISTADIPGKVAIALAAQAGKIVQGTGMPNGVVTAAPGTLYVDTASTNGASVWRKAAGTGNTGWVIVDADTGWRDVFGLLNPSFELGTLGYARLKRVGTHVTFNARLRPAAELIGRTRNSPQAIWNTFPAGTAPENPYMLIGRAIIFADGTGLTLRNNDSALEIRYGAGNWSAADLLMVTADWEVPRTLAWPSPLFGTA